MGKPHYMSVDGMGSRIFHRYWDGQERKQEVIDGFPIELFIKGKTNDAKALDGSNLSKVEFSQISDAKEFIKEHSDLMEIHGQTSMVHQFIAHKYPGDVEFDLKHYKIAVLDIETSFADKNYSDELLVKVRSSIGVKETALGLLKKSKDLDSCDVFDVRANEWLKFGDSCYGQASGFPDPMKAEQPIIAISVKLFGKPGFVTFGQRPFKCVSPDDVYYQGNSEMEMLTQFIGWWNREKIDILTGWNVLGFDVPFLVNRLKKVCGEGVVNKLSPFHSSTKNVFSEHVIDGDKTSYRIIGIAIFDYIELYKKFAKKKQISYKLDYIAEVELKSNKLDYTEYDSLMDMYYKDHQKFVEYNQQDCLLIEQLDEKLNFMFLAVTLVFVGKVRTNEIFGSVKFWDTLIYNELLKTNVQIPPEKDQRGGDFEGGYVKEPIPGKYKWIISLDLTSLYPSIIRALNMSPECIRSKALDHSILEDVITMKHDMSGNIAKNLATAANGATFSRDSQGVMPMITAKMFAARKSYKNKMLSVEKEVEAIKNDMHSNGETPAKLALLKEKENEAIRFDCLQNAFKIALNSLFGVNGNAHFRYYDPNIAEGITLTGQAIIRFIANRLNEFMNNTCKTEGHDYITASDTDSVYVECNQLVTMICPKDYPVEKTVTFLDKFIAKYIEPFIAAEYDKFSDYLNLFERTLSMKREAIADVAIWRGKKNYILQVWDNEGVRYAEPHLKMMGIETARSSTPKIVKGALEKTYDILLNKTEADLQAYVKEFYNKFVTAPLADIAFPRGVSDIDKWEDKNTIWKSGTPVHVKASFVYNNLLKKHKMTGSHDLIRNGDKIKFIYLKEPNYTHNNAIAFVDELYKEFDLDAIVDKDLQYEKTFLNPLKSFSDIVGMDTSKRVRLDSFFDDELGDDCDGVTVVLPRKQVTVPVAKSPKPQQTKVTLNSFFE